jgi:hypothetical protein
MVSGLVSSAQCTSKDDGKPDEPFVPPSSSWPNIRTVIADAGHQSIKLARYLLRQEGWRLQIVRRRQRAFKITGLTGLWSAASLGFAAIGA